MFRSGKLFLALPVCALDAGAAGLSSSFASPLTARLVFPYSAPQVSDLSTDSRPCLKIPADLRPEQPLKPAARGDTLLFGPASRFSLRKRVNPCSDI